MYIQMTWHHDLCENACCKYQLRLIIPLLLFTSANSVLDAEIDVMVCGISINQKLIFAEHGVVG